jgi:hypothetical protein
VSRFRIPFLPTFFTILAIAFAVVLVARIRAYNGGGAGGRGEGSEVSSTISGPSATSRYSPSSPDGVGTNGDAQSGTVVAVSSPNDGNGGSAAAGRRLTPREQRYRELLNAPPPPKATVVAGAPPAGARPTISAGKPPEKPQSTIAKILQPIKNLFGNNPSPQPAPQQTRQPPNPDTPRERPPEKDPSTDTTPPQVIQVQFDPPQVRDGDSTSVIVTATDDLAGIRGISGTVTSPNAKALQGFACQREAPESNRYIGRVTIPKDAEEGLWHINFLNASDMASNSVTLSYAQSPVLQAAQLKVTSSRPDNTPPTVKNAWLDRRAMRAGDKNTLFVQADDDKSGVNLVSAVFISPKRAARIGVACRGGDSDLWTCEFTVPVCLDCGDWSLEQIQLQDKASNMGSVQANANGTDVQKILATVVVNISGDSCDGNAPVLQSIVLDQTSVPSTPQGTLVDVRVAVVDDGCGVASVSAQVIGPSGGNGQFFAFSPAGDSNWVGRMPIPRLAGKGIWKINWLQVMDKGNNLRVYYAGDPLLAKAIVLVR